MRFKGRHGAAGVTQWAQSLASIRAGQSLISGAAAQAEAREAVLSC